MLDKELVDELFYVIGWFIGMTVKAKLPLDNECAKEVLL